MKDRAVTTVSAMLIAFALTSAIVIRNLLAGEVGPLPEISEGGSSSLLQARPHSPSDAKRSAESLRQASTLSNSGLREAVSARLSFEAKRWAASANDPVPVPNPFLNPKPPAPRKR